jgi:hypothetical protein
MREEGSAAMGVLALALVLAGSVALAWPKSVWLDSFVLDVLPVPCEDMSLNWTTCPHPDHRLVPEGSGFCVCKGGSQ